MNDIYKAPESNLGISEPIEPIDSEVAALRAILKEESGKSSIIIAILFTVLSIIPLAATQGSTPLLILLFPAFVVGLIIKYSCRLINLKYRIISSLIFATLIFLILAFGNILIAIGVSALNFFICLALSRRPLSHDQAKIIYRWKIGKIKP